MKGMAWESPRGPMSIDPDTRDVIHNVYIRRVERMDGELTNRELVTSRRSGIRSRQRGRPTEPPAAQRA